jgi:hypothetical protein
MSTHLSETPGAGAKVDAMPYDRRKLAELTPEERSAIYLNSIRKMMVFFVVLVVVGIVVGVIMALVGIGAIHGLQTTPSSGF